MEKDSQPDLPLREKPIYSVALALQEAIGTRLTAYAISERDPRKIGAFASALATPDEESEVVLRDLAEVTEALTNDSSPEITRATFIGANPLLDGVAPIELFHQRDYAAVMNAGERLITADGS